MRAIDALLFGLVDYAGLFPPAAEDMRRALENYASYLKGPDRYALGRFIVPLSRLPELEDAARGLKIRGTRGEPWRLSALVSEDVRAAAEQIAAFNRRYSSPPENGSVVIDVVELKATRPEEIEHQQGELPKSLTSYFEIPLAGAVTPLVTTIAEVGARAKMRTGGVTPEAFPPARQIVDFMTACRRASVPFKATAGLHHPVRGDQRLTYEPDSPRGYMYGFLNVFIAAALLYSGASEDAALAVVQETDAAAFSFGDAAISWEDKRVTADQIGAARAEFAIAFGSCSFREPIDELEQLTRQARAINK